MVGIYFEYRQSGVIIDSKQGIVKAGIVILLSFTLWLYKG